MKQKQEKIKTNPCPQDTTGSHVEYVGVDISQEHLDVHNAGRTKRFSNDSKGINQSTARIGETEQETSSGVGRSSALQLG